jgi:hypothetical protein
MGWWNGKIFFKLFQSGIVVEAERSTALRVDGPFLGNVIKNWFGQTKKILSCELVMVG